MTVESADRPLDGLGRYDDTWQLTGDGWKLAHRHITNG